MNKQNKLKLSHQIIEIRLQKRIYSISLIMLGISPKYHAKSKILTQ